MTQTQTQPWWDYPRIDNFGQQDPQGSYWKPDSNIEIPGGYPVAALLPGTVSNVQTTSWGQTVVTIALDNPLNSEATHTFYEHLSQASVVAGNHVNAGDIIGYNNPAGQVPLGFGLYSGDTYGSGSAWSQLQSDLAPGGAGLLNPVNLLNAASQGKLGTVTGNYSGLQVNPVSSTSNVPIIGPLIDWFNNFTGQFNQLTAWLANPTRMLKMLVGLILLTSSIVLLVMPGAEKYIKPIAEMGLEA